MNKPMTISCSSGDLEKQIVFLTKRLIRVRSVRCLRSSDCLLRLPMTWWGAAQCRRLAPQSDGLEVYPLSLPLQFVVGDTSEVVLQRKLCRELSFSLRREIRSRVVRK